MTIQGKPVQVVIRRVSGKGMSAWLSLRRGLWPLPGSIHRAEMKSLFGKRGFICLIAWDGKKAIGFAEAMIRPFANGCEWQPVPFLEGLYVEPSYRRKLVGRKLVERVEMWALKKGFRELGSDAYLSDLVSHKAHRAYGFTETERVIYFRKVLKSRP
jgi:aminoglycoside 6'-N-acetyltransferase I